MRFNQALLAGHWVQAFGLNELSSASRHQKKKKVGRPLLLADDEYVSY